MKMTKLFKRITIAVFAMLLTVASSMDVRADEPLYVHLGEIMAKENELIMQVGTNLENSTEGISYKVTLGDDELDILSVSDYETEKMQTSYAFLVDVSGSIKKNEMDNMKNILKGLINGMGENDNASIMLIGNDIYAENFASDKDTLLQSVEEIETLPEDTNLYYALNQAMGILATSEQSHERKCIVILSDGKDDQISGITEKEVETKINETNIPICSVAVRGNSSDAVETAKIMGSFSRMSPGGVHMIFGVDGMDAENVVSTVFDATKNVAVLKADISDYEANGTENYLQVEVIVDGVGSATDGYNVKSVVISEGIVSEPEEESVQEEIAESISESEESNHEPDIKVIAVIGVIAVIIISMVILSVISHKKQKKKKAQEAEEQAALERQKLEEEKQNSEEKEECEKEIPAEKEEEMDVVVPTLEVQLTKVGNIENEALTLVVKGELTIGRKKELADVVFEKDQQLSGKHCKLVYDGTNLIIEDLDSLNGTLVNGVPICGPYQLEPYDKFYIGSMEWRIHW